MNFFWQQKAKKEYTNWMGWKEMNEDGNKNGIQMLRFFRFVLQLVADCHPVIAQIVFATKDLEVFT